MDNICSLSSEMLLSRESEWSKGSEKAARKRRRGGGHKRKEGYSQVPSLHLCALISHNISGHGVAHFSTTTRGKGRSGGDVGGECWAEGDWAPALGAWGHDTAGGSPVNISLGKVVDGAIHHGFPR